jgi:hypothetical protein
MQGIINDNKLLIEKQDAEVMTADLPSRWLTFALTRLSQLKTLRNRIADINSAEQTLNALQLSYKVSSSLPSHSSRLAIHVSLQ